MHSYSSALSFETDDATGAAPLGAATAKVSGPGTGFGFEASIGMARGQEGLKALDGLAEGFRKL